MWTFAVSLKATTCLRDIRIRCLRAFKVWVMPETTSSKCSTSSPFLCQRLTIEITGSATEYKTKKRSKEMIWKGAPLEANTVLGRPRIQRTTIKMALKRAKIIVAKTQKTTIKIREEILTKSPLSTRTPTKIGNSNLSRRIRRTYLFLGGLYCLREWAKSRVSRSWISMSCLWYSAP